MEEKKMGFFTKIKNSITSPKSYAEFLKTSLGKAVLYLLLLCIILGGISSIRDIINAQKAISTVSKGLKDEVPDFTFQNGEFNVPGKMPIFLGDDADYPIIINTDIKSDSSLLKDYSYGILITKTSLFQKSGPNSIKETPFESLKTLTFTKGDLSNWTNTAKFVVLGWIIIGPLFSFVGAFIISFILCLIGLILNSIFHSELLFKEIYTLSIYALTFPLIVRVVYKFIPLSIPFFSVICFGIGTLYLALALKSISKNKEFSKQI